MYDNRQEEANKPPKTDSGHTAQDISGHTAKRHGDGKRKRKKKKEKERESVYIYIKACSYVILTHYDTYKVKS